MTFAAISITLGLLLVGLLVWRARNRGAQVMLSPRGTPADLAHATSLVLFDNNVYRDLVGDVAPEDVDALIAPLIAAERSKGIQGIVQPLVLMEIAARIADPSIPNQTRAKSALVAAALHAEMVQNGIRLIASLPDPETIVCQQAFGQSPRHSLELVELLTSLCRRVEQARSGPLDAQATELILEFAKHVSATEAAFVTDMFEYLVRPFNPALKSWDELGRRPDLSVGTIAFLRSPASAEAFAVSQVAKAAALLNLKPSRSTIEAKARTLAANLGVAITLYNDIVGRIVIGGCNLTKKRRENWFWDLHLALCVGASHSAGDRPITLVTSDGDIVAAAKSTGCGAMVRTYSEYRAFLGLS